MYIFLQFYKEFTPDLLRDFYANEKLNIKSTKDRIIVDNGNKYYLLLMCSDKEASDGNSDLETKK